MRELLEGHVAERRSVLAQIEGGWSRQARRPTAREVDAWIAAEARRFLAGVSNPMAPALWEAEMANVLWMSIRAGVLPAAEGPSRLNLAARLGIESVPTRTLLQGALLRSVTSGIAVYETLFVELARRENCPLATFDRAALKAFPDIAARPGTLVSE